MRFTPVLIALTAVTLGACTTKMYTSRSQPIARGEIPTTPMVADLKVDLTKKVTASGTVKGRDASIETAKDVAIYNAMTSNNADLIIDPICKCTVKNALWIPLPFLIPIPYRPKIVTCEVTGYPATYLNVHVASAEELAKLKDFSASQGKQQATQQIVFQTKKGGIFR